MFYSLEPHTIKSDKLDFIFKDILGSPVCTVTAEGTIKDTFVYEPFGKMLPNENASLLVRSFTGHFAEDDEGLYYCHARWYDADIGRFLQADSILDGFNRYAYCHNNPINYCDPTGRMTEEEKGRAKHEAMQKGLQKWREKYGHERHDGNGNGSHGGSYKPNYTYGEPGLPTVNIVVTLTDETNENGAYKGSLTVYWANDKDNEIGLMGNKVLTVPVVSGSSENAPTPEGEYKNLDQEKTSTSSNPILKDDNHGGSDNTMIRLPNTGGDAIHQGNQKSNQNKAYTEGCVAVTSIIGKESVNENYSNFKNAINPYGYNGVKVNVYIKKAN